MSLTYKACGAVILAGGQSRRMGRCKALLTISGETLIARLAGQLSRFPELLLSANDSALVDGLPLRLVRDHQTGLGPLAGLQAALAATKRNFLLCVPCDLPNFTAELAEAMLDAFPMDMDALVCVDSTGQVHPLCGVYAKAVLPVIESQLQQRDLRMQNLLTKLRCTCFSISPYFPDEALMNVNTPDAFEALAQASDKSPVNGMGIQK